MAQSEFKTRKNDIFVSYSRRDKPFVEKLVKAFNDSGRDVWVDWEDIPLTAEWLQEIYRGIEEADQFVIIISPDSMTSDVILNHEIPHAVKHNKRIVPILHRDLEKGQKVPDIVGSHNWIFFNNDTLFDSAFARLTDALNTDLEHVQSHTRVINKAVQWESFKRDRSYLLRGQELAWAEDWMRQAADKQPEVTPLQAEYIYESRSQENRRQHQLLAAVTVALVVAVILSVVSILLFQQAERNRKAADAARQLAEAKSDIIESLELAANAQLALSGSSNTDLAIALALEAVDTDVPSAQAELALAEAAYAPGTRFNMEPPHAARVMAVSVNQEDTIGATGSLDGVVRVWDLQTGSLIQETSVRGAIRELKFDNQGNLVVLSDWDVPLVTVYDLADETANEILPLNWVGYTSGVLNDDGSLIALGWDKGDVTVFDIGGNLQVTLPVGMVPAEMAFSGDSELLAVVTDDQQIGIWDWRSENPTQTLEFENEIVNDIVFTPNKEYLVAGTSVDNIIAIWNVETGELQDRLFGHADSVYSVSVTPDNELIVSGSQDGSVRVWEMSTGLQLRNLVGHASGVWSVEHLHNDKQILSGAANGSVRLWDAHNGAALRLFRGHEDKVYAVDLSGDGQRVLSGSRDRSVVLWDADTGFERRFEGHTDVVWSVNFHPDGERFMSTSADETVRIWRLEDSESLTVFDEHNSRVWDADFSPDGSKVVSVDNDGVILHWNLETGEVIHRIEGGHGGMLVRTVAYSPDGISFMTGGADMTVAVWDAETGEERSRFTEHNEWLWSVDYSPDGTKGLSSATENVFYLWDVATGETISVFEGHGGPVYDVDFGPGGNTIISGSADNTMRLWNVNTGRELRRYVEHSQGVWDVAVSDDGTQVATVSGDRSVVLWEIVTDLNELTIWTQNNRFVRELTCNERRVFNAEPLCEGDVADYNEYLTATQQAGS